MNPFTFVYLELLFRPLYNLLVGITNFLPNHNVGLAIILVTAIVRVILLPPTIHQAKQSQRNQQKMKAVQKDINKIKKQHHNDRTKQAEETMKIYKQAGINPAAGCLPLLIQLPILIALYRVFLVGLGPDSYDSLYSFVSIPENVSQVFLGLSMTEPSLLLGVIAGASQFVLMKLSMAATTATMPGANESSAQMMASMQKNMMYFFPVMTVFIALQLPAALALYWVASTVFAIIQQRVMKKILPQSQGLPAI